MPGNQKILFHSILCAMIVHGDELISLNTILTVFLCILIQASFSQWGSGHVADSGVIMILPFVFILSLRQSWPELYCFAVLRPASLCLFILLFENTVPSKEKPSGGFLSLSTRTRVLNQLDARWSEVTMRSRLKS